MLKTFGARLSAQICLLALLAAAAVGAVHGAEGGGSVRPPPVVLLHLSDLHFSVNTHGKHWRAFGDREGDAALWASELVPRLGPPAALLVTGDITDGKTARGVGQQQEEEWLGYARLLANLTAAGLPTERVWDVPGNHDVFNVPLRGGPNDFFARHAAEGARRSSPHQRVFLHRLRAPVRGEEEGQAEDGCPAAWMVGIDPTPEPGLRSPTNFAGLARPSLLAEAHAALLRIRLDQPPSCRAPTLVYCHYPLSTIDSSPAHAPGPPGILLHAAHPARAMQGLTLLLAEHNVSAVFSGHLHSAFGQRLHRLHTTPRGGHMAELETAAWKDDRRFRLLAVDGGALAFLDLMFHTRNAPRMPGRSDAAAMADPAWQEAYEQRGWAVTAVEPSAAVLDHIVFVTSPPDGRYSPLGPPAAASPQQQRQQQQQDEGADTGDSEAEGSNEGWVRALVFSLPAGGDAGAAAAEPAGQLSVELAGFLPDGPQLFSRPMQQAAGDAGGSGGADGAAPALFEARGEATISCVGRGGDPAQHCRPPAEHVEIQVAVRGGSRRVSHSPRQPVALRCVPLTASHQRCWVAPAAGAPLPLRPAPLEWLGLAFNWPVLVHRLFLLVWAFQVGAMLVVPRLLASRLLPRIAASPLLQCRGADQPLPSTPRGAAASGSPHGLVARAGCVLLSYLLWPAAALCLCASVTEVWAAMLGYSLYLLVGPWCLYTALSGYPLAALFAFGVIGRLDTRGGSNAGPAGPATAGWLFVGTPDTMFVSLVSMLGCVLPATLWVACVVARRLQLQPFCSGGAVRRAVSRSASSESSGSSGRPGRLEAGARSPGGTSARDALSRGLLLGKQDGAAASDPTGPGRFSFSGAQLAALAGLFAFNFLAIYHRAWALMGPSAILASPGLAWTLLLALLLVCAWGGPRRPGGQAAKGE